MAEEAARLDAAIDEALARSVLYHAVTLGQRPPAEGGAASLVGPAGCPAIREAAEPFQMLIHLIKK